MILPHYSYLLAGLIPQARLKIYPDCRARVPVPAPRRVRRRRRRVPDQLGLGDAGRPGRARRGPGSRPGGFTGAKDVPEAETRVMATITTPPVQFRTVDGVRIRYADSGGSQETTVLLTSPWPESVFAFTPMWASLAEHARLFAIDLPGFGASERRDELLSPRAMGDFLAQLIAEVDLGIPHLVAPDVGTSAALFAAAAHPERIASVIVGTGGAAVPLQLGEPLKSWVLDPDLDKYRRMDARDRRGGGRHDRRGRTRRHPRGLPGLLRRRPLRRVDALRPPVSRGAAGAGRAAAADHDPGHDHQRPQRPGRPVGQRRVSSTSGCPPVGSWSSTPATSSGRKPRRSTRPRSSSRSRPAASPRPPWAPTRNRPPVRRVRARVRHALRSARVSGVRAIRVGVRSDPGRRRHSVPSAAHGSRPCTRGPVERRGLRCRVRRAVRLDQSSLARETPGGGSR